MKFLFVCHRWGEDLVGGAEIHHRRLVRDLVALGHDVEVWTTTGRDISPVAHWGVEWQEGYEPGLRDEAGVRVRRFPLRPVKRWMLGAGAKVLQRAMEREEGIRGLRQPFTESDAPLLVEGWHLPEREGNAFARWTAGIAYLAIPPLFRKGKARFRLFVPRPSRVTIQSGGWDSWETIRLPSVPGESAVEVPLLEDYDTDEGWYLSIETTPIWRPLRDHRSLGVRVTGIELQGTEPENSEWQSIPLTSDYRAEGRKHFAKWSDYLWRRSSQRSPRLGRLFDWLRGPRSPQLARALRTPPPGTDYVIAANLPWNILPLCARNLPREAKLLAMPLWHIEDDYYYWPQYAEALRRADLILANTEFSAREFFARFLPETPAAFVGPGVPLPEEQSWWQGAPTPEEVRAWRRAQGIADEERLVLSVSRKSPEKRYDLIERAMEILRAEGRPVRFALVGPDHDGQPVAEGTRLLGRLEDRELDLAYRACDAFVLMSESESFGMVLAEAMLRGKPVVANRHCGPAASLIREGEDGLLAKDAEELAEGLRRVLDDQELARRLGTAGEAKARAGFTQRAATERLLGALEQL